MNKLQKLQASMENYHIYCKWDNIDETLTYFEYLREEIEKREENIEECCIKCWKPSWEWTLCDKCEDKSMKKLWFKREEDLDYHIKSCWDISWHLEQALRIINNKIN
jgi:hypothetical protein